MNAGELDDFFLEGGDELMNSEECPKCGVVNSIRKILKSVLK
ncbi:MAG: hypothetical protein Q7J72_05775 [Candidatus Omnitrophota bacterium]|nr:hypothetical protein [Candidatus Omnitrophota bacterium]